MPMPCIPPGARLHIEDIPEEMQTAFGVGEAEEVTFTQITNEPFRYRDAFRFSNGVEVLVQKFPEGTPVEVLALLAHAEDPETEAEPEEVEAVAQAAGIPYEQSLERSMRANA